SRTSSPKRSAWAAPATRSSRSFPTRLGSTAASTNRGSTTSWKSSSGSTKKSVPYSLNNHAIAPPNHGYRPTGADTRAIRAARSFSAQDPRGGERVGGHPDRGQRDRPHLRLPQQGLLSGESRRRRVRALQALAGRRVRNPRSSRGARHPQRRLRLGAQAAEAAVLAG